VEVKFNIGGILKSRLLDLAGLSGCARNRLQTIFVLKTDSSILMTDKSTTKMSLDSLVYNEIVKCNNYIVSQAMIYVLNKTDIKKFGDRVLQAHMHPSEKTKCVLLEFNHTAWGDVELGAADISDRLPGTDVSVYTALTSKEFQTLALKVFTNGNPKVNIYVRQRINSNGTPDLHKKQLVLIFDKGAYGSPTYNTQDNSEICNCDDCEDTRTATRPYSLEEGECEEEQ